MTGWRFWIDRGGTFTDVVARNAGGREVVKKLLSENRERYDDAALEAIRMILSEHGGAPEDIDEVRIGTTVATNALLERKGARTLLVITQGFADALEIGQQSRPDIFARNIVKPALLHARVIEAHERVSAEGEILKPLDELRLKIELKQAYQDGCRALAVACMHGWAYPAHEQRIATLARALGFTQVSTSSEVSGLAKFIPRADTTVADAYLSPTLRAYVEKLAAALPASKLYFMQSNGGLARADAFRGKDAVLSGPAGGVVGMAAAAGRAGFSNAIGFDMGGTSTDVSHYAGAFERTHESAISGVRISAPMLQIHTIAAGGGSICSFDGGRFRVGPESAGANPGPACYRRGGPLTVTDCNVMLGRVRPEFFPAIFGPDADQPLDRQAVEQKFDALRRDIAEATDRELTREQVAEGFLAIANLAMAEAIRKISIQRGYNPKDYALVAFGGAGGQHACAVADLVGIDTIVLHPLAGLLSAWGIGRADLRALAEATIEQPLDQCDLAEHAANLSSRAYESLNAQGANDAKIETTITAQLKYQGADTTIDIALTDTETMAPAFSEEHQRRFGFTDPARPIVVASVTAEAIARTANIETTEDRTNADDAPQTHVNLHAEESARNAPVFERASLSDAFTCDGPALVLEQGATTFVAPGWRAEMNVHGDIILTRARPRVENEDIETRADPILLEVFNNRFMGVAEEMGLALQASAASVNIKERLDFSCALFNEAGGLVANAPHIPVHLGSMSDSVREILKQRGDTIRDGDIYMLNAPHAGGTHLPDITVIAPVILDGDAKPAFFTAARGHHADIGGISPGSMPPDSRTIEDEGVLIENFLLVSQGRFREQETRALLGSCKHPARDIGRNIADLKAQIAACARGAEELKRLVAHYGRAGVAAYMRHVQNYAEEQIKKVIDNLAPGQCEVPLDIDAQISVAITPDHRARRVRIDFSGTSLQHEGNFNAPLAITRAAVLYVFRTLIDNNIPLNEGCLNPIDIVAPEGCLLNPKHGAAVVAGNVETSQAVVDALYGALGKLAASQGTMNNFTFGDATRQYYETICGGAGAGPSFDGASAVQTHMTNSRLTDPEVLEMRFPVLVEEFSIRRSSGGSGVHKGGDGAIRRIKFREPMDAAILSNRRTTTPFGLEGGAAGAPGKNAIQRTNGAIENLPARATAHMSPGDIFIIETPGGGGFGKA